MESLPFASLAHVRILLLPVGSIQRSTFEKCAAEIRSFDAIRLGDIVPVDHNKDERSRFMPRGPLSTGHLHLSFPTHPPPLSHAPLALVRPSHFPLAVIGVAACSQDESMSSVLAQFNTLVAETFPPDSVFPLAKNCFAFEDPDGNIDGNTNLGDSLPGLVVIPSIMGNKKSYIGTLLGDLCSHLLGELGHVVQTLESPIGNEYLNSTPFPILPPLSEIPTSLDNHSKRDSLPPLPARSQPEIGTVGKPVAVGLPPATKRNMSSGPGFRQSTLASAAGKRRLPGIGAASSHGRLFKVLGDFFLLAGRNEDAVVWYTEAIALFKLPQDVIWHASALEGLATVSVLDAWAAGQGNTSGSAGKEPYADISEKLTQAVALYHRSPTGGDADQPYPLLAFLYTCGVLRHASLLFAIWSAKGWGPLAFTTMLQPGPTPHLPPTISQAERHSWITLERMSTISGISRSAISMVLAQAHGPWLLHLGPRERVAVLEAMASMYACLGYRRKEAYILREVLGCILDLLVCGREEDGQFRRLNTPIAGLGIQGLSLGGGHVGGKGNVGVRQNESTEGNESVLRLLKYVCKVLGINLDAVRLVEVDADGTPQAIAETEAQTPVFSGTDANDLPDMTPEPYGWPELQVGVVREAVAVAEALPDYPAVAQFALSSLKTLHTVLLPGDQHHLYTTSARALSTARRRGDTKYVEYWSGRPIVAIDLMPLPVVRIPLEKPASALTAGSSDVGSILPAANDPFLYNPRKLIGQGRVLVVQNENLEFIVTLQNPYVFDIELQSLALSTTGVPFESKPVPVIIPSKSYHQVVVSGKPTDAGTLVIRGCVVRAPGGASREFIVPISADDEERRSRRRGDIASEKGRSKYSGLECFPWERNGKRASLQVNMPASKESVGFLECKVAQEQPLLRIRRTSLTHGAVMLYNGEMSVVRITLENVSSLPIDFLRLSFEDSTIAPAQQALVDGDLSVFDTYETEYDLIHRPMFSWENPKEFKRADPGQKVTLSVNCFGKVGCTSGTIHVSYSYVHRAQLNPQQPLEVFHTRQLSYPVMVTVYHMLECHEMDIIPFERPVFDGSDQEEQDPIRKSIFHAVDEASWCLFSIEVRNTYGLPFEMTFQRGQEGTSVTSTTSTVPPGSTSRIVMPIKKFLLSDDNISRAIPTLSDRQFVVTKSNLTSAEEKAQRELFWYREELLKSIRGSWREVGGVRSGTLSLRQQRLTLPMLETLRTETARVQMSLVRYSGDAADPTEHTVLQKGGKYQPPQNEFVYLRTKVINLSPSSLVLTVDLNLEPIEHVIFEGIISAIPIGRLRSGESGEVETALCFLACGRFEISARACVLGVAHTDNRAGKSQLIAIVKESTEASEPSP